MSPRVLNIADLRLLAKRRLPRVAFDYIDGGADSEVTLRENSRIFDDVLFRPRCAVSRPRTCGRSARQQSCAPLRARAGREQPDVLSARRSRRRGRRGRSRYGYTLSTLSGCRVDEVGAGTKGPLWYQLYLVGGRDVATAGLERAMKAGASALFVTIDTAVAGLRERDFRNGTKELLTRNPWTMLPYVIKSSPVPGGCRLQRRRRADELPERRAEGWADAYADVGAALEQSRVCWADLRWIRENGRAQW